MPDVFRSHHWFVASAFIVASCSQGDAGRLAGPTDPGASAANGAAIVGSLAEGDVRTGSAPLEIDALRMDRQTPSGASVLRQYAEPGREYRMEVGETIELWAEWDRGDGEFPKGLIANPRLLVDWGDGGSDFTGCGSCLLKHTYPRAGRFTVTVTLNDLAGTTVTRTFILTSTESKSACGLPASTDVFFGDESDSDSSDFDNAETPTIGPVDGANTVGFTCTGAESFAAISGADVVRSHGESSFSCYGHGHDEGDLDLFVEVHNPDTNAWTRIFTQPLDEEGEYGFNGLAITFPGQKVDRVRLLSDPGQGNTYHDWGGATVTVSCR